MHKAGYINIIGSPNVGKSTLLNSLTGEKLAIVTSKVQTTRHRILGIINGDEFQIIISDTPGIIKPRYKLQEKMMDAVSGSLQDADIFLPMLDITQDPRKYFEDKYFKSVYSKAIGSNTPFIFVLNKLDLVKNDTVDDLVRKWKKQIEFSFKEIEEQPRVIPISALKGINLEILFGMIIESLPESEPYFPKDQLTDRPEKYFIAEIIREKIFVNFREEIPYATEVVVDTFKEEKNITRIRAEIYVERKSQKPILIGKQGSALKKIGTRARLDIEMFLGQKVFLELFVKVKENWRNNPSQLKSFGY